MRNWQAGNEIITFPNNLKDEEEDRKGFINPLKKVVKQPQEVKVGPGRWPFEPTYIFTLEIVRRKKSGRS